MPIPLPPNKLPSIKPFTSNPKEILKALVSDIRWKQLDENKKLEAINQAMPSMQNEDLETQKAFKNKLEQEFLKEQQKPKSYGVSGKWEEPKKSSLLTIIKEMTGQTLGEKAGELAPVPPLAKPFTRFAGGTLGYALSKALETPPMEKGLTYPEALKKGTVQGFKNILEGAEAEATSLGLGKVLGKASERLGKVLKKWSENIKGNPEIMQSLQNIYEKTGEKIPLAAAEKTLNNFSKKAYQLTKEMFNLSKGKFEEKKYTAMQNSYFNWIANSFKIPIDKAKTLGDNFIKEYSDLELGKKYLSEIGEKQKGASKIIGELYKKPQPLFELGKKFTIQPGRFPEAVELKTILEPYAKVGFSDTTTKELYNFLNKIIGKEEITLIKVLSKYGEPFKETAEKLPEFTFNEINSLLKNLRQKFAPALKTQYGMGDLAEGQEKRFIGFVKKVQNDSLNFLEEYYSKTEPNKEILKAIKDFRNAEKGYGIYSKTYKEPEIISKALTKEAPQEASKQVAEALSKPENIALLKSASPEALKTAKQKMINDVLLEKSGKAINKINFLNNINNLNKKFDENSLNLLLGKDNVIILKSFENLLKEDLSMKSVINNTIAGVRGYQNILYSIFIPITITTGAGGVAGGLKGAIAGAGLGVGFFAGLPTLLKHSMENPDRAKKIVQGLFTKIDAAEAKPVYNTLVKEFKSAFPKVVFPTYEEMLKKLQQQPKGKSLLQTLQENNKQKQPYLSGG